VYMREVRRGKLSVRVWLNERMCVWFNVRVCVCG